MYPAPAFAGSGVAAVGALYRGVGGWRGRLLLGASLEDEIPLLWRFHAIHHSAEEIDWLVNTRAHPFDIVFVRLCGFVPMYALGLAQPMIGKTVDVMPLLIMLVATLWGFFIHANLRWRFGPLEWLIATPGFHHWHHTNDEHINKNYASMLPWMDKLFGTWYMPKQQWPAKYGIDAPMAGFAGQLLQPLVPRRASGTPLPPVTRALIDGTSVCPSAEQQGQVVDEISLPVRV